MYLEHLLVMWKNSLPVLKSAFGISIAGRAQGVPGVTLGRGQRVTPRLGWGVQLLQQTVLITQSGHISAILGVGGWGPLHQAP